MECGELFVMISGVVSMQQWSADNWASLETVSMHVQYFNSMVIYLFIFTY